MVAAANVNGARIMRISSIGMMAAALVFGVTAAFLAKIWLENQTPEPVVASQSHGVELGTVVVASRALRFGMDVSKSHLSEIEWPDKAIPKGAYKKISDILNGKGKRIVLSAIARNEPVLKEKITGPGQRASLSALVGEGMKAVAIPVNDVRGVAGFVLPGERVDILFTRTDARDVVDGRPEKAAFADVLLQNVRVLAIDQLADDRTAKPEIVKTVTIEVDTLQAQKVALASAVGKLSLALRSAGNTDADNTRRISLGDLKNGGRRVAKLGNDGHANIVVTRAAERAEYSVPRELAIR